jgi:hypothetical protein
MPGEVHKTFRRNCIHHQGRRESQAPSKKQLSAFLLGFVFDPEDIDSTFLKNVELPDYTASHLRKYQAYFL